MDVRWMTKWKGFWRKRWWRVAVNIPAFAWRDRGKPLNISSQDIRYLNRDLNRAQPEQKSTATPLLSAWSELSKYLTRRVQITEFLNVQVSLASCSFLPLTPALFSESLKQRPILYLVWALFLCPLFSNTCNLCSPLEVRDQVSPTKVEAVPPSTTIIVLRWKKALLLPT